MLLPCVALYSIATADESPQRADVESVRVESESMNIAVSSVLSLTVAGVSGVSSCCSGATVSTAVVSVGSAVVKLAVAALAKTLLADTITIAAIAAKTNFFMCVEFFVVKYMFLFMC